MPFLINFPELCIGILAAAILGWVLIRRLLGKPSNANLNKTKKSLVGFVAAAAYVPALIIGYISAIGMINVVARPGPWLHLTMVTIMALTIGIVGALVIWLVALIGVFLLKARNGSGQQSNG